MGRRETLARLLRPGAACVAAVGLGYWLRGRSRKPEEGYVAGVSRDLSVAADPALPEMVIVRGEDPARLVRKAFEELGGVGRFISPGDVVVIKPNMAWDRAAAQAANTNPAVVAEVARLCQEAGARKVVVADVSVNEPRRCSERSGIAAAARSVGAEVVLPEQRRFRQVDLRGDVLRLWPVFEPFLTADKVINIPIAKHHSLTGVTLGMKNWYGILGGQRQRLHQRIHESLADLADFMRPTLTLIDAYRVMLRGGPTGGSLRDVELHKTLIAGTDPVALDAYAAKAYWGLDDRSLLYLRLAGDRGLGNTDLAKVRTSLVSA